MRIHRPFIFIASLALMAWCGLMGVLVLIHGFNEHGLRAAGCAHWRPPSACSLVIGDSKYWWRWGYLPQR